ncbi:MAG TPA: MGMT family protein [Methylomirabilota bacterium]|nr:MGMT family protein [Methylomirabilota bacterium]
MKMNMSRGAGSGFAGKKIDWTKYTVFQQKVYKAILKIPEGQVLTYGEVAKKIGQPRAARAVGMALKYNQDAPIIPCHRVVGYNDMGGYSARGGMKMKLRLLKKEGYKSAYEYKTT